MGRATKRSKARDNRFFDALAENLTIGEAAKRAGYSRRAISDYAAKDPEFKQRFMDAKQDLVERLEREADRRAIEGVDDYRSLKGPTGEHKIIRIKRYSDALLMFRLRALKPEVYRDNYKADEEDHEAPPISIEFSVSPAKGKVEVTRGKAKP